MTETSTLGSQELRDFVAAAKCQGISDDALAGLLRGRGWPRDDAYRAIGDYYETQLKLPIPLYKRTASARDAFLYLFSFSALATWTVGLARLSFHLIEHWIPDPLAHPSFTVVFRDEIAASLASVLVAFPFHPANPRPTINPNL